MKLLTANEGTRYRAQIAGTKPRTPPWLPTCRRSLRRQSAPGRRARELVDYRPGYASAWTLAAERRRRVVGDALGRVALTRDGRARHQRLELAQLVTAQADRRALAAFSSRNRTRRVPGIGTIQSR